MAKEYDLVVLGGGTGGYVSAIRATQLGMKVAIVEANKLGGTCLHEGCIPSKSLLRTAELYRQMNDSHRFGIDSELVTLRFDGAQARMKQVVNTLHNGVKLLVERAKIDVYEGFGRILGSSIFSPLPGTISIEHEGTAENTLLHPKHVLIATGSKPKELPGLPFDKKYVVDSTDMLNLKELPESVVIVGGGVIGIEWASMLIDFGVQVTVVEQGKSILLTEDTAVQKEVYNSLKKRGVTLFTETSIVMDSVRYNKNTVTIDIEQENQTSEQSANILLVATGRSGNVNNIGLENTSIKVIDSFIKTNEMYQTEETHIYAIGDCIGGMQLAHVASAEGIIAVEHMANGTPTELNELQIPSAIYSYPEVGKIGLTEQEAIERGFSIKVGTFSFKGVGKAHVFGDTTGLAKIISDEKTDDILGVHFVGPNATEMIAEASLASLLDATAWEISQTIHPHPSLSEIFYEAALAVDGVQIHG